MGFDVASLRLVTQVLYFPSSFTKNCEVTESISSTDEITSVCKLSKGGNGREHTQGLETGPQPASPQYRVGEPVHSSSQEPYVMAVLTVSSCQVALASTSYILGHLFRHNQLIPTVPTVNT
eukprot:Lithocolla_globosa_v1_NODE_5_length_12010_cov_23.451945.p8 type:complete len:121 gc:universal NODE_5_length_12010_cov_23.451945:9711-10073(+)